MYVIVGKKSKEVVMVANIANLDTEKNMYEVSDNSFYPNADQFDAIEVASVPEGFRPYKFVYENGEFVSNPAYVPTENERISQLEEVVQMLLAESLMGGAM